MHAQCYRLPITEVHTKFYIGRKVALCTHVVLPDDETIREFT